MSLSRKLHTCISLSSDMRICLSSHIKQGKKLRTRLSSHIKQGKKLCICLFHRRRKRGGAEGGGGAGLPQ